MSIAKSRISHDTAQIFLCSYLQAGANMIVSGSAVIKSDNPRETIQYMRNIVEDALQKNCVDR